MTLDEKVSQLMSDSPAIERLGIPAYNWWNECLHGVARAGRATVFPEPIGLASTWDTGLMRRVAEAISDEARAKYHEFVRRGKRSIFQGLTFWTPNINLFRDPRWGRGMETYGEDPYLTGRMAVQFIQGLQGDDPKYLKVVATAKHYAVHSGPEPLRHAFDAIVDEHDFLETYLPQFEDAVREGHAASAMCAYNRINGEPACSSNRLLEDILRKEWGFDGYVVSDCGAVGDIYLRHKTVPTAEQGVARALRAGTDLDCGVEYNNLPGAVKQGLISEAEIDRAVRRLLLARFKLGVFDPPSRVKYAQIPYTENDSPAHRQLALDAARESIVLLKNEHRALPLSKSIQTVAVIGPDADDVDALVGNYNGEPSEPVTVLAGIRRKLGSKARVLYERGSDLAPNMPSFETVPASALWTSNDASRQPGLTGEYFASGNFDGRQHRLRELSNPNTGRYAGNIPKNPQPLFTRVDPLIDFRWWENAPRADMDDDDFGIRWSGYFSAPVSGTYQLGATGMNAWELYLDGKPVAEFNNFRQRGYRSGAVALEAGKMYQIRLEFHEYLNDADIRLVWAKPATENPPALPQADAYVVVLGLSPRLEGEQMNVPVEGFDGGDRVSLDLPRPQEKLLETVGALGKPVVLVLMNGSALAVNWAREHVPAIIEAWYPGQAGGDALADVLFGDVNPGGRLPVTFYKSVNDLPPFTDYSMRGRTYRYFSGEPLFPFGFGLSYTTFAYRNLRVPATVKAGDDVPISVEIENNGRVAGDEVVQVYVREIVASGAGQAAQNARPSHLAGFERVHFKAGEKKTVRVPLSARQFSTAEPDGRHRVKPGTFEIRLGGAGQALRTVRVGGNPKELN
jgi:beta-glucosidase